MIFFLPNEGRERCPFKSETKILTNVGLGQEGSEMREIVSTAKLFFIVVVVKIKQTAEASASLSCPRCTRLSPFIRLRAPLEFSALEQKNKREMFSIYRNLFLHQNISCLHTQRSNIHSYTFRRLFSFFPSACLFLFRRTTMRVDKR